MATRLRASPRTRYSMNTHRERSGMSGIARLFARRKKAKTTDEKPHIALSLVPSVVFTAVPSSPPPSTTQERPTDTQLPRPGSAPIIRASSEADQSPSLPREPAAAQVNSDSESMLSEPGYATVRTVTRETKPGRSQGHKGTSDSPASSTGRGGGGGGDEERVHSSLLGKLDSASPPQDHALASNSSLPSVTSTVSLPSDSVDGSPRHPFSTTRQSHSPPIIPNPIPVYASVDKSKKKQRPQGSKTSERQSSPLLANGSRRANKTKGVDHEGVFDDFSESDNDDDEPYFSPHRPPPPPQRHGKQTRLQSHSEPRSASALSDVPVYTFSDAPQPLTGDCGYVFTRTTPDGNQQQFIATPVRITPIDDKSMGVPRSHSTPTHSHGRARPASPASDGWGGGRSPSPSGSRSHSRSTSQLAMEIVQQLVTASQSSSSPNRSVTDERGSLSNSPTPSNPMPPQSTGYKSAAVQTAAEILQQMAAGSLQGVDNLDSSVRHSLVQPVRKSASSPGLHKSGRSSGRSTPTKLTAEILQHIAKGSLQTDGTEGQIGEERPQTPTSVPPSPSGSSRGNTLHTSPTQVAADIIQQLASNALPGVAAGRQQHSTSTSTQTQPSSINTQPHPASTSTHPHSPSIGTHPHFASTSTHPQPSSISSQPHSAAHSPLRYSRSQQLPGTKVSVIADEILQELSSTTVQGQAYNRTGSPQRTSTPPKFTTSTPRQSISGEQAEIDVSRLSAELVAMSSRHKELMAENMSLREEFERHRAEAKAREDELQTSFSTKEEELALSRDQENLKHHLKIKKLEERVAIVCEENGQLQFQLEQQKKVTEDMSRLHTAKVDQLNAELSQQREERHQFISEISAIRDNHTQLTGKMTALSHIPPRNDVSVEVEELKRDVREFESMLQSFNEGYSNRRETELGTLRRENAMLKGKLSGLEQVMKNLQTEYKSLQDENRNNEDRIAILENQVDDALRQDRTAKQKLDEATALIKKTAAERDAYARIAEEHSKAKDQSLLDYARKELTVQKFHQKMATYGQQVSSYTEKTEEILKDQERKQREKDRRHQQQLRQLKTQLTRCEEHLDDMEKSKRKAEAKLNLLWSSTTNSPHRNHHHYHHH